MTPYLFSIFFINETSIVPKAFKNTKRGRGPTVESPELWTFRIKRQDVDRLTSSGQFAEPCTTILWFSLLHHSTKFAQIEKKEWGIVKIDGKMVSWTNTQNTKDFERHRLRHRVISPAISSTPLRYSNCTYTSRSTGWVFYNFSMSSTATLQTSPNQG